MKAIVLFLFATSCGSTSHWSVVEGVCPYTEDTVLSAIDIALSTYESAVGVAAVEEIRHGNLTIAWTPELIDCGAGATARGCVYPRQRVVELRAVEERPIAATALAHELMHLVLWVRGAIDYEVIDKDNDPDGIWLREYVDGANMAIRGEVMP